MNRKKICFSRLILFVLFPAFLWVSPGCAPKLELTILKPAEVNTEGISKVAVGRFEIADVRQLYKLERNGNWQTSSVTFTEEQLNALSDQIRARVVTLLSTTPYFDLVYTDEFNELATDAELQEMIAAGGYRTEEVDAVINGKVWLTIVKNDGVEPEVVNLEYIQGGSENSFNYKVDVLAFWPYKSVSGSLSLEIKMTRLEPTEVVAVTFDTRRYSEKIAGRPANLMEQLEKGTQKITDAVTSDVDRKGDRIIEQSGMVLPSFDQLVADLSESIAAQFVRRVSITQKTVRYEIAGGGNDTAQMLIEVGAYEKAIEVLNETLNNADEQNPDDIYNLGLCYEATGDYGLAEVTYNDAIERDPENLTYIKGIGRIQRLKRENLRLRQQLNNRS